MMKSTTLIALSACCLLLYVAVQVNTNLAESSFAGYLALLKCLAENVHKLINLCYLDALPDELLYDSFDVVVSVVFYH